MSFEQEWNNLKSGAGGTESTALRLNQATTPDTGPGGGSRTDGSGWLIVERDDLGHVGHAAYNLWRKLRKSADLDGGDGGKRSGATERAAVHLKAHSLLGAELARTAKFWTSQVNTVLQGCAHISNHLDFSKNYHGEEDRKIGAQILAKDGSELPPSQGELKSDTICGFPGNRRDSKATLFLNTGASMAREGEKGSKAKLADLTGYAARALAQKLYKCKGAEELPKGPVQIKRGEGSR
ncbi:hypothetical protein [Streptomyces sp. 3N207]|uniref:hypothetical protein n=1 Tax=Streptomyces sp. 3N207 TaxID=3457417 RepID=UPI003FD51250